MDDKEKGKKMFEFIWLVVTTSSLAFVGYQVGRLFEVLIECRIRK